MTRPVMSVALVAVLFGAVAFGQGSFSIRAASEEAVAGWERMQVLDGDRSLWVAPAASLTSADVQSAERSTRDGATTVAMVFNEAGASKMRALSKGQMNRLIALVVDGRIVWAPMVRSEIAREAVITGPGPSGLRPEVADRLIGVVKQK